MKSQQSTGASLPPQTTLPRELNQQWQPVHPFLRCVSALLSVVLVFSGVQPIGFAETIEEAPGSTEETPLYRVSLDQVSQPSAKSLYYPAYEKSFLSGPQSSTTVVSSGMTLLTNVEQPFLITATAGIGHLKLSGISFSETTQGDFDFAFGRFDALSIGTLSLFGKTSWNEESFPEYELNADRSAKLDANGNRIPVYEKDPEGNLVYEKDEEGNLVYEKDAEGNLVYETIDGVLQPVPVKVIATKIFLVPSVSQSIIGLELPIPSMTLLTGTYDGESVKSTRFLVETDQVWKIDQSTLAGAVVPEPLLDGTSLSGGSAFVPVRVEAGTGSAGSKMLTLHLGVSDSFVGTAWLDLGPGINVSLNQNMGAEGGELYLVLGGTTNTVDRKAFNGTVNFHSGVLNLGPNFMSGATAPVLALRSDSEQDLDKYPKILRVAGLNTGSLSLSAGTYSTLGAKLSIMATTMFDVVSREVVSSGTFALQVRSGTLTLGAMLTNGLQGEELTISKRGSGSLRLVNDLNDFTGGLRLQEGTLIVGTWAVTETGTLTTGLSSTVSGLGFGNLYVGGGTANTTIRVSNTASGFDSPNTVTLLGSLTGTSSSPKVTFQRENAADGNRTAPFQIPRLELLPPDSVLDSPTFELSNLIDLKSEILVNSGTLIKSGSASLILTGGNIQDAFFGTLMLKEGTLTLDDREFTNARLAVTGAEGTNRVVSLAQDVVLSGSSSIKEQIWSAGFRLTKSDPSGSDALKLTLLDESGKPAEVLVQNSITISLESGTLSLGNFQKPVGTQVATLAKAGNGTLLFAGENVSVGTQALQSLALVSGPVRFAGGSTSSPMILSSNLVTGSSTAILPVLTVEASKAVSVSGTVSGTGFTKTGPGALAFTGANTISGSITLESGSLSLASGTGAIFVGNAQTGISNAPTLFSTGTVSGAITVGSGATSAYTALLASSGTTEMAFFRGPVTLASDTVGLELQAATGGTLDFSGAWNVNGQPVSVGSSSRDGTVRLSSALSTSGSISVNAGALQVGTQNALATSPVNLLNGAVLNLGTFTTTAGQVTLTSGTILGTTGSLRDTSLIAQSGNISATLDGTSSLTKTGPGAVTMGSVNSYSGATRVEGGSLTSGLPLNSAITVEAGGTYNLTLSATGTYSKTITNEGVIRLTGASSTTPVVLTIDQASALSGSIEVVGNNVTLRAASGVNEIFAQNIKLTLNGAKFDANGTTQTIPTISFLNGGSLISLGTLGTIKTDLDVPSSSRSNVTIILPVVRDVFVNGGTLEFYSGSLGDLASGGSYGQIVTQAKKQGDTLKFDQLVAGSTSVIARVSSGTSYTLNVESTVTTPLLDIQNGVTAVFKTAGTLSTGGTLQIGGTVDLDGNTKSFSSIRLTDGSLVKGTLSGGSLEVAGTGASSLSATLAFGFGNITKNEDGIVTISGSSPNYGGSLFVNAGTVTLGTVSALGGSAKIGGLATGAILQLAGSHLEVEALSGSGILENSAVQAATLTFNPKADTRFDGVLRNGSPTGALSVVKTGSMTLTLGAMLEYTGGTTVKQGSLVLSNVLLPAGTALDVQGGALDLGAQPQTVASYSQSGGSLLGGALELTIGSYQLKGGLVGAVLSGTAVAVVDGNVTLNAAATYTGGTTVKAGTLSLGANGALWTTSALTVQQGGAFSLGGKEQVLASYTQTGGRVENGTITADGFSLKGGVVDARLGGIGSATVDGVVTLNQAAAYTGKTTVQSGSLILGPGGALSKTAEVEVRQGGTFSLGNKEQELGSYTQTGGRVENGTINAAFFTLSGGLVDAVLAGTGAGATVQGDVTLNRGATYSGQTTIVDSGKLTLGAQGTLASASSLSIEGGTLNLNGKAQTVGAFTITRGLVEAGILNATTGYNLQGGSISAVLAGTASLGVNGNVTLFGVNTVTGDTTIASGTLTIANPAALSKSALVSNGGSIRFASGIGAATFAGLSGTQALALSNGTGGAVALTLDLPGPQIYDGVLSGDGGLTVVGAGALTLTAPSTFTGETTINGGLLSAGNSLVGTSAINLNAGTFKATSYNAGAALKIAAPGTAQIDGGIVSLGNISNSGNLSFTDLQGDITIGSLSGTGTTNFAAGGTINGVLSGGIVNVAGDLVVNSTISGGSITTRTALLEHVTDGAALRVTDSALIQTVSNGTLVFEGNSSIKTLSGGSLTSAGDMSVEAGTTSGPISGAGALLKQGSQSLTLNGNLNYTGETKVLEGTLFIGENTSLSNSTGLTVAALAETRFKNQSGTVTLKGISGEGKTVFDGNAKVLSSVEEGVLSVAGTFTAGTVGKLEGTGPLLVAGGLDIGTLQGGVVQAQGASQLENLAGGSLKLAGGQSAITRLTGADSTSLTLEGTARVQVSSGNYSGSIHGTGSLEKVGSESLDLANAPNETVKIAVQGGMLSAGNLLTGNRQVSVSSGAILSLSQVQTASIYSGTLSGSGATQMLGTGLSLGSTGSLNGALTLGTAGFKLDISAAGASAFGDNATLNLLQSGILVLGGNQEVALNDLKLEGQATLTIQTPLSTGAKIFYDPSDKPDFLLGKAETFTLSSGDAALNGVTVTGGSVTFDALSQVTEITAGTYQAITGVVQSRGGGILTGQRLLLDPKTSGSVLRLGGGTFTTEIIAGGSFNQGVVALNGPVTTGSLTINSGIRFEFNQTGSLTKTGGVVATPIANAGTLVFAVAGGTSKSVANVLSGLGTLEKLDAGTLDLLGANTRSGATLLKGGVVQLSHQNALGSGAVKFNGGSLRYAEGVTTDLSLQIGTLADGSDALVNIGNNTVTYGSPISGAGGFQKTGAGTLVFAAAESFTGGLVVGEGVVQVGNGSAGSLEAATTAVSAGATLRFARNSALPYNGVISGSGAVEQAGTGILTLGGSNTGFSGNVNLKSGVLNLGAANALGGGTLAFQGGILQVGAGVTNLGISKIASLAVNDLARIDTNSQNLVLTAALTGDGGLVKSGEGTLTLNAGSNYTGKTSVLSGTLAATNLLSGSLSVDVLSGALLSLSGVNATYSGTLAGTGRTNIAGTQLTLDGGASLDGAITVLGGNFTLNLSDAGKNPFGTNATLDFSGGPSNTNTLSLGSGQEVELNALTLSTGGTLNIQLGANASSSTIYYDQRPGFLSGSSDTVTIMDGVTLSGGTLGSVTVSGGSVTFEVLSQGTFTAGGTYQATAGRVQLRGAPISGANTLLLDPKSPTTILRLSDGTFQKGIIAGGTFNQGGVALNGAVTTDSLTINSGILFEFNQTGSLTKTGGVVATPIANAGTLVFAVAGGMLKGVANVLSGVGSLEKTDAGTLALSGANTRSGTTLLRGGVLRMDNNDALGSGLVTFNGGALKYGEQITKDISSQIGTLASGVDAIVDTGSNTVTYGSPISGAGGFQKTGTGTLVFAAAESFTGDLVVGEGVVQVGNGSAGSLEAASTAVSAGATLRFARNSALQYNGALSGSGAVEQAGTGTLTLGLSNTGFTGNVNLKSGVLNLGAANALGDGTLAFQGGTLQVGAGVANLGTSKIANLTRNDLARIDTNSQNLVLTAALTGDGGLVKSGEGTLTLSAGSNYTGKTSVLSGTLAATNLLSGGLSVDVSSGALLSLSGVNATYSGTLAGTGRTHIAGTQLALGSGASLDGAITILGGNFTFNLSGAAKNPFGTNATLDFSGGPTLSNTLSLAAGQEVELNALTLSSGAALTIQVAQGAAGAKIYYDQTPVFLSGGSDTVTILDGGTLGSVTASGGSVTFEVLSQGTFTSAGTYQATAGRVQLRGGSLLVAERLLVDPKTAETIVRLNGGSFSQGIVAGGSLNQGVVAVGGTVQASQVTIKSNLLMRLAQAGSFAATGNGALPQIDNAGTLQFSVDSGKSKPVENALTGTGSVEKLDAGTLVLESKLNTYSGKTILSGGILQIGDNTALGTGSVGSIVFNGGALRYGDRVTADLSKRISPIQAGLSALVDVGTNEVVYASSLSGAGGLSKSGTGTLQFAANQNFEGDLSVAAGVVQIGSGTLGSIKAAAISVDSGASVRFKRSDSLVYAGTIKGAGTVEQAGDGTLTLSGDGQAFSGTYVLSSGVLLLDGANALSQGSITFKNGTLKYGQSGPSGAAADLSGRFNPVDAGFTATIDTSSSNVTYSSSLTGSGTLRKLGTGTLAFSDGAVNPLRTSVGAGALHYNGSQAINAAGTIDTSTGTTVQFTNADNAQFTGSLQGAGSFVKAGMGALEMLNAQAISGEVRIAAGSLVLGVKSSLKGLVTLEKQATLDIASTEAALQNADLTIRGNLIVAGGITLVKSVNLDGGTLTLRSATDETAFILVTGSIKGEVPAGNVQVGTLTTGANGVSVIGGSLSGSLRNLPANSELNFQGTGDNKQARLFAGTFSSISAQMGTNLKLEEKVTVNGGVLIGGSSILTLGGSSVLSASSLNIASGSTVYLEEKAALKAVEIVVGTSNAERLIVSGTLELANQVLKGSGTIEGTVRVAQGAVLSPGNSPGTLTVGTLAIGEGGTLVLEHGQAAVDKLVTGGSLTLSNGAQILLVDYDRSLLAGTSGYAFSGSVATSSPVEVTMAVRLGNETGTVGDDGVSYPIATSALYSGSLTSAGSLVVKRLSAAQVVGAAGNLEKVALSVESRLKALSKTPFEVTDFDRIGTGATAAEAKLNLAQQLSAINPSAYAELAALSTQRTLNLHQGLVGHFSSVRANLNDAPDGAFSAWTTGYGAGHKQDGNRSLGTAGFTASTWGDMFGVEQRIGGFLLGVTGAAGRTSATFSSNPGSATTDSWHGGLYGALDMDGLILESGAMLGATDTRVRRTILATGLTTREGRATLSGSEWTANLGLAKPIAASEALTITPSIRVIVQGQSQNAAAESDLSGLEVSLAKQRTTTLQHQAGMEIRRKLRLAGRPAAASLQLDWIHNYNAKGRDLNMALSGDPSASYAYKGSDAGADSIHIGAAFEAALTERVTLRLGGEYQSQTGLSTVRGSVSLGYQF